MTISGKTRVTALLGYPVEHSLSPAMHNAAFESLGLDYCYVAFPVHSDFIEEGIRAVRALGMAGVNVTIPHKESVISFLDEIDDEAAFIGAVNTIVNDRGRLRGYNTDGRGFMRSLAEQNISVSGRNILVVGTGGAARAISYYLMEEAEKLILFDIDTAKRDLLVSALGKRGTNVDKADAIPPLEGIDIIVNATPLGMKETDPLPVDPSGLHEGHAVCDLIYRTTPLLRAAAGRGCAAIDGSGMLLWQGALAFELWTGAQPPVDVMRRALFGESD